MFEFEERFLVVFKMPQEFHVLQCYSCESFQVHIVKKVAKWSCKMCGEKQSIKKVFARGNGKDCRLEVQELNEMRIKRDENVQSRKGVCDHLISEIEPEDESVIVKGKSKWAEFMEDNIAGTYLGNHVRKQTSEGFLESWQNKVRRSKWDEFISEDTDHNIDTSIKNLGGTENALNAEEHSEKMGARSETKFSMFDANCNDFDTFLNM